jgi:5'-nucleotidase
MVQEVRVNERMGGIAVDGRPADCVKLAISSLWPERYGKGARPDLLISGMNAGANCGINVIYSGTVAAAIEGAFLGVPSIAVSMLIRPGPLRFDVGARWGREVIERLLASGLPDPHEIISINIPTPERDGPCPPIRVCPMNTHGLVDAYERRVSPSGDVYYWAAGHGLDFHATDTGTDVAELMGGCVTVTPLRYDLTRHEAMTKWRGKLGL